MANIDLSKLPPELQRAVFEASKASGQQPTSGGIAPDQEAPVEMPAPGSFKNDPEGAIKAITQMMASKATGTQLNRNDEGQLTARVPVNQPLLRLFGVKKNVPINAPNFADTAQTAGIAEYLPSGLPRTPEGSAFVGRDAFNTALSAAQSFGPKSRASFYSYIGNDPDSQLPVTFNSADNTFYRGGEKVGAEELGRLLSKVKPQLEGSQINEVTNLINAQTQLNEVKSLFDKDAVGPVQARLYNASKLMGVDLGNMRGIAAMTDDKAKLRTVLASGVNDYIKAITGAQMSEPEARRIMAAMPDANAADEAFMPMLEQVLKITEMKLNNRLNVLETQGTVGVKELRGLVNKGTKEKTPKGSNKEPSMDLTSAAGIKAAFDSGKLDRNQAKALLKAISKGGR